METRQVRQKGYIEAPLEATAKTFLSLLGGSLQKHFICTVIDDNYRT